MSHPTSQYLLLLGLAFSFALSENSCAQDQSPAASKSDQSIVVLRNGGVLCGRAVNDENACVVYLGNKSELRLPRDTIDFVCGSMQQAYKIQRDRIVADDFDASIDLAAWCVRHDLLDLAENELATIPDTAKPDIRVRSLLHKIASRRRLLQAHAEAPPKVAPESLAESPQHVADRSLPQISSRSIGLFNTSVQSRLLNGCAASGCHGIKSNSSFHLECESPGRPTTRRMTFENFTACFALIDQANPEQSKLLEYASTPHADLAAPVYRQGSRHYEAIANWVKTAALAESSGAAADMSQASEIGQVRPASAMEDLPNGSQRAESSSGGSPLRYDFARQRGSGVDPFDPEVFNRLYGAKPTPQTNDDNPAAPPDSFGFEGAPQLQAPQRLSDAQKNGAIRIGERQD